MSFGRIRRDKSKVGRAKHITELNRRGPTVRTVIGRSDSGRYWAVACIGARGMKRKMARHMACGRHGYGRTLQSAIAKALKSLSGTVANRGRRNH